MKIKLLKPYQLFTAGAIVDFGKGVNQTLIDLKKAELYEEKKRGRPPLNRDTRQEDNANQQTVE